MKRSILRTAALAAALAAGAAASAEPPSDDPYRWLEEVQGARAMAWVRAENAKTLGVLEKDPRYAGLYEAALGVVQAQDRLPAPRLLAGSVYNFWQDAQHVRGIWRRTTPADYASAQPRWSTVLDVDALATSEHANWVFEPPVCLAPAESRCLLSLSDGGEDAVTLREFDLAQASFPAQGFSLPAGKQDVAWENPDALLVAREWQPGELTTSGYAFVVKRLRRGEPLAAARELFRGSASDTAVAPIALADGQGHRALIIDRNLTFFESENYLVTGDRVRKLALPAKVQLLALMDGQVVTNLAQAWSVAGRRFKSGSLVAFDLQAAARDPAHLKVELIYEPGARETFDDARATQDALIVTSYDNVRGRAAVYRRHGGTWSRTALALPDNLSIDIASTDLHGDRAYLRGAGFLQPPTLWQLDAHTAALAAVKRVAAKFDASSLTVQQFEASSSDAVRIPYFVVHRRAMPLDGSHPTILHAYGGFQVSLTPDYEAVRGKLWLEPGNVYVLANIRGGGEFGPAWHEAGLKTRRQIIYDDFAAVARDVIARGITSERRLGIQGGSNGGLLMGVEFTQHPQLWRAVDIEVPLLDMVRFEQIAAGSSWVGEYGSVANPDEAAFLSRISPYANIQRGGTYPEALIWTTSKDDRVGPQHARKFAARLSEYGIPYLFYEVTEGGHDAGANLAEKAHTAALEMMYFTRKLVD